VIKNEPKYFGKKGFRSPKSLKGKINAINVGQLDELLEKYKKLADRFFRSRSKQNHKEIMFNKINY